MIVMNKIVTAPCVLSSVTSMNCSVLQCVAVCVAVNVAVCCGGVQCVLQCVEKVVGYNDNDCDEQDRYCPVRALERHLHELQCVAVCCCMLHCVALCVAVCVAVFCCRASLL